MSTEEQFELILRMLKNIEANQTMLQLSLQEQQAQIAMINRNCIHCVKRTPRNTPAVDQPAITPDVIKNNGK